MQLVEVVILCVALNCACTSAYDIGNWGATLRAADDGIIAVVHDTPNSIQLLCLLFKWQYASI